MAVTKIKNMEKFAELTGISRPTVSKYFHAPDSVRKSTRDKIEKTLKTHNYQPNIFAINQNRKSTKTIGIVVPYLADPFFVEIVRRIERRCIEAGFWPLVFSAHGQQELEINALETLRSLRPSGALIAPLGASSHLKTLQNFCSEVQTVFFDSNIQVGETFVGSDNFQSIRLIVDYLCRSGEPPCFFEMSPVNPNADTRTVAYRMAMEKLGHKPQVIRVKGQGWEFEKIGFEEGKRLISKKGLPSQTVLCSNDRLAIGLIAAAYQCGLRVGIGSGCALRIAGHDDHPWSKFTCPPLTTVSQDYTAIAERSFKILFDLIQNETNEVLNSRKEILYEGKIVLRASA